MPAHNPAPAFRQPASLPPIQSAALMQGPSGVSLHLLGDGGAITQVPLTLAALREIAALAGAALPRGDAQAQQWPGGGQDAFPG